MNVLVSGPIGEKLLKKALKGHVSDLQGYVTAAMGIMARNGLVYYIDEDTLQIWTHNGIEIGVKEFLRQMLLSAIIERDEAFAIAKKKDDTMHQFIHTVI